MWANIYQRPQRLQAGQRVAQAGELSRRLCPGRQPGRSLRNSLLVRQVRFLEQQNKVLETKWHLLQQQGLSDRPQGLESFFEAYLVRLRTQLEQLQRERGSLDAELKSCQGQEEEYKAKYVNHSIPMGPGGSWEGLNQAVCWKLSFL